MKTYNEYKEIAIEVLREQHGTNTVELVTQIKNNLHLVTQSVIMMDLMKALEEKEVKVEPVAVEEKPVKPTRSTTKK